MPLDDRKQHVLRAVVALYGAEGEPVGSSLLAQYFDSALSSATLRNEMAALTKLGLLEQPHTSAGRVPSAQGYRYYYDHLLGDTFSLPLREKLYIDEAFRSFDYDPEHLAKDAAVALASLTGCATVVTTPKSADVTIAHFEVVQVGRNSAAVLAITGAGSVRTRTAKFDAALQAGDTARIAAVLNRTMAFRNCADITGTVLAEAAAQLTAVFTPAAAAAYTLLKEAGQASIYIEGQRNLLRMRMSEHSLHNLMGLFGDDEAIGCAVSHDTGKTVLVLGENLPSYPVPDVCVLARQYYAGAARQGAIALIGPTRMPYRELIPQLEYFAYLLGEAMSGK